MPDIKKIDGKTIKDETARNSIAELQAQIDNIEVPTKTSDLTNDSDFATETYVDNAIENMDSKLINQNGGGILKIWAGTKVEYDALLVKDEDTVYLIEGTGGGSTTTYTITNNLTNCTNSNTATSVDENSSYVAIISANDGYKLSTVTVTMGGTDITSTAYSNGNIVIESVTGDITITASATAISSGGDTDVYDLTNAEYSTTQFFSANGELTTASGFNPVTILDYIEIPANATITMEDASASIANIYIVEYDTNKTFIQRQKSNNDATSYSYTVGSSVKYIRLTLGAATKDKMTTMLNNVVIKINGNNVILPSITVS